MLGTGWLSAAVWPGEPCGQVSLAAGARAPSTPAIMATVCRAHGPALGAPGRLCLSIMVLRVGFGHQALEFCLLQGQALFTVAALYFFQTPQLARDPSRGRGTQHWRLPVAC